MVLSSKSKTYSWADKVKITEASTRFTLDPIPRTETGGQPEITSDMLTENAEQWNRCMVGFFLGFRMNYHTVNTVTNRAWKSGGLESVMSTANGFWLFRFQSEDQMHAILERGPWMFGGKTMILQQWHPQFIFDKNRISKLPVWIRLHGLPFSLWSRKGLSAVASMVGRPLSCDETTFCCTRLDYARVCVELDASLPLVTKFDINTDLFKEPLHLEVEYEWQPPRCGKCHLFGHVCSEDKGNAVTKPAENGNLVPALDGRNLHEREERQPPHQPSLGQKPQHSRQPQKTHTKITQDSNSTSLSQTIVHHKKGRCEGDPTMEHKNQETTPTSKEDEERVRKGKMQVEVFPIGTVNESASLQSKETYVEEEVNETTAANGGNTEDGDWSPFIKVRKKKGGKKKKEALRL